MTETRNKTNEENFRRLDKEILELGQVYPGLQQKVEGIDSTLKELTVEMGNMKPLNQSVKSLEDKLEKWFNPKISEAGSSGIGGKEKGLLGTPPMAVSPVDCRYRESWDCGTGKMETNMIHRNPMLDFPLFDGKNPREWVRKAQKYFQILAMNEEQKLPLPRRQS